MVESGGSKVTSKAAIKVALTDSREQEKYLKEQYAQKGIKIAAVDFGGEYAVALKKIAERAVVASKREGLIEDNHREEGSVAGATRDAISQLMNKALGLNIGGKIGIARYKDHISVVAFFEIGLLNLNEVAIGLAHRVV